MNLYKEEFVHYSPKDFSRGIAKYFLGKDDTEAYHCVYGKDADSINNEYTSIYFDSDDVESRRDEIISAKGEMNMEYTIQDAYYGYEVKGWGLVKENLSEADIISLVNMNIISKENNKQKENN